MVPKGEIFKLYADLETIVKQLLRKDMFWTKCHPCYNSGNCCVDSETIAFFSEWIIIRKAIAALCYEDFERLRKNVFENIQCPFRGENRCLIHEVRPLVCRLVPYFVFLSQDSINFSYPGGSCTEKERITKTTHPSTVDLDGKFVKTYFPQLQRDLTFCNGIEIQKKIAFQKLRNEESKPVMEWLRGFILDN